MVPQIISTSKLQHLKEEKTKNSLDRMKIQTIDLRQNNFHVEMQKKNSSRITNVLHTNQLTDRN